jgi:WD40 repeat protein
MANLKRFRELVTAYRKPYTQMELAEAIKLPANELSHRLGGTGRQALTQENVLNIVVTLAEWQTLNWEQAEELLRLMDYPLGTFQWKTRLQEHLSPPNPTLSPTHRGTPSTIALDAPAEGSHRFPSRPRLFQARDLPKGYVPRPEAFDKIKRLLLNRESQRTTAITTALRGAGGFGKTTLASALCHDPDIQAAFPDGILWVDLGEQPPRTLDLLNRLLASLEKSHTDAVLLQEAQERWQAALQDRVCLLVIDDVWQPEILLPLLKGGPQCVQLITTRNDLLLPKDAARVLVDAMYPREAVSLLCQDLPEEISQAIYQPKLEALVTRLGCWPLLLTLANGMLVDRVVEYHLSIAEALTTIAEAYQTCGVTAFRLDNVEERQRTVEACLKVSMQHLETFIHAHYHATERYQELAMFPEDTDIPLMTLQLYWKGSAELEPWETTDLCTRLRRLSLLLDCDLRKGTIRLHDVFRSYLIQRVRPQLPTLHIHLLDAYQQAYGLTRWADLPQSEEYLWHNLIFHLCQAGRLEALQATLTDPGYLANKMRFVSISALEADLLLASTVPPTEAGEQASSFFKMLHRGVGHISHLLRQVQTEAEVGGLLLSHLDWGPTFATQQISLEHGLPRPFLTAWHPLPGRLSSALFLTLHGHTDSVWGCAVSPDGRWIVSSSWDKTLKIWDTFTGMQRKVLKGHTDSVSGCAVSPDGRWIVSSSFDHTLKVWDATTGTERKVLKGHTDSVSGCAVSPDGRWIVSSSFDHTLKVWDVATGAQLLTLSGHTEKVISCAVSPDGRFIVSSSLDCTLKVWDATNGTERLTLTGHTNTVIGCAVSPDGSFIVSASDDDTLKLWDATTGAERLTLKGHIDMVIGCAVSPDGRWIVSSSWDKTLKIWDATTGAELLTLSGHTSHVSGCAVSPDGHFIVSSSWDKTLKIWDATNEVEHLILTSCAADLDARTLISSQDRDALKIGQSRVSASSNYWTTWKKLRRNNPGVGGSTIEEDTERVIRCAVSPDGSFIVSASSNRMLKIWDASTGAERLILSGHKGMVLGCVVSPDSCFVVSSSTDNTLKVWDVATGVECFTLSGHTGWVYDCAVSPNGQWIVSASEDCTLIVWSAVSRAKRLFLPGHTNKVFSCVVSPDSRFIVSSSADNTLKVWDVATGAQLLTLSGHVDIVNGCVVSLDGSFIVSASQDKTLKIWDATTGIERITFSGHTGEVSGCAVSSNGRTIISASNDCTLKVWNAETGQCILTFPTNGPLFGCLFHPDEEHLVVWGQEGVYFLRLVCQKETKPLLYNGITPKIGVEWLKQLLLPGFE